MKASASKGAMINLWVSRDKSLEDSSEEQMQLRLVEALEDSVELLEWEAQLLSRLVA